MRGVSLIPPSSLASGQMKMQIFPASQGHFLFFFYSKDAIFIFIMSLHHARVFFGSPVVSVASLKTSIVVLDTFYSQRIDIFQLAY